MKRNEVKEYVKKRYGEIAQSGESCCQSCCEPTARETAFQIGYTQEDLTDIPESSIMGLGCGNPVALASLKEGEIVLDLGSGGGIDVFLAAKKVGPKGKAIGIDMTEEMISRSRGIASEHGYENVEFRLGEIENLPVEDNSVDVVISNCVINLSPDKDKVFQEAYRVLKPDGRMMISDVVTEEELPLEVRKSLDAWAGCIAGALEKGQYLDTIRRAGFRNVRITSETICNTNVSKESKVKITSVQIEAHKG